MSKSQLPVRLIILGVTSHLKVVVTEFLRNFDLRTYVHYFINVSMGTALYIKALVQSKSSRTEENFAEKYGSWAASFGSDDYEGKNAVVTGATDDIGLAYVKELAARKMNIVLISRTEENRLKEVAAEIENEFIVQTRTIVANFAEGRHVYERIEKELSNLQIGILVNNVGMNVPSPLLVTEMTEDLLWNTVHENCIPVLIMIRMILPRMLKNRKGAIVNISSMIDLQPAPFIAVYSATKAFITVFTKALQLENRGNGVTIQILSPGAVNNMRNMSKSKCCRKKSKCCRDILSRKMTDFVKHAIGTLGISGNDAGSHLHSILRQSQEPSTRANSANASDKNFLISPSTVNFISILYLLVLAVVVIP